MLTPENADLARWLYLVAGFSRSQLARDFETTIAEIEEVVSTGLAQILNPASNAATPPLYHIGTYCQVGHKWFLSMSFPKESNGVCKGN